LLIQGKVMNAPTARLSAFAQLEHS
jgi:hypothetical protein